MFASALLLGMAAPALAGTVVVDPESWDFGELPVDETSETVRFTVLNDGDEVLEFYEISGGTVPDQAELDVVAETCSMFPIRPGWECNVWGAYIPLALGEFTASITLRATDGTLVYIPLTATGIEADEGPAPSGPSLEVVPGSFDFGLVDVDTTATTSFTLTSTGTAALAITQLSISDGGGDHYPEYFSVGTEDCAGQVLAPDEQCGFEITYTPRYHDYANASVGVHSDADDVPTWIGVEGFGQVAEEEEPGCATGAHPVGWLALFPALLLLRRRRLGLAALALGGCTPERQSPPPVDGDTVAEVLLDSKKNGFFQAELAIIGPDEGMALTCGATAHSNDWPETVEAWWTRSRGMGWWGFDELHAFHRSDEVDPLSFTRTYLKDGTDGLTAMGILIEPVVLWYDPEAHAWSKWLLPGVDSVRGFTYSPATGRGYHIEPDWTEVSIHRLQMGSEPVLEQTIDAAWPDLFTLDDYYTRQLLSTLDPDAGTVHLALISRWGVDHYQTARPQLVLFTVDDAEALLPEPALASAEEVPWDCGEGCMLDEVLRYYVVDGEHHLFLSAFHPDLDDPELQIVVDVHGTPGGAWATDLVNGRWREDGLDYYGEIFDLQAPVGGGGSFAALTEVDDCLRVVERGEGGVWEAGGGVVPEEHTWPGGCAVWRTGEVGCLWVIPPETYTYGHQLYHLYEAEEGVCAPVEHHQARATKYQLEGNLLEVDSWPWQVHLELSWPDGGGENPICRIDRTLEGDTCGHPPYQPIDDVLPWEPEPIDYAYGLVLHDWLDHRPVLHIPPPTLAPPVVTAPAAGSTHLYGDDLQITWTDGGSGPVRVAVYASTTQPLVSVEVVDTGAHTVAWDDLEAAADSPIYDLLVVVSRFEEAPPDTLQLAPGSVVRVHSPSEVITVNLEDPS